MKKLSEGGKLLICFTSSFILLILMILKGKEVATVFESVLAEIAFVSVLFLATLLFLLGAIRYYMDEYMLGDSKRPKSF